MRMSSYLAPPLFDRSGDLSSEDDILGWMREAMQQGMTYLQSQRAYMDLDRALDIIGGPREERMSKSLSRVHANRLKRQIREVIATESNIRPDWYYKTDNSEFDHNAMVLNKMTSAWYLSTFADRSIREALQWAAVMGTGYVSPVWERDYWVAGRGDIKLHTYGPRDVIPVQIGRDHDIQNAYTVIIKTEVPIARMLQTYPEFADRIRPDREQPAWLAKGLKRVQRFLSPVLSMVAKNKEDEEPVFPVCDFYNIYILDLTINNTGRVVPMGKPGTNWYYEVPYIGMEIDAGFDESGRRQSRAATRDDCLLFPSRRLVQATNNFLIPDDGNQASPWWHGKVPLAKFSTDDWPWDFLGYSLTHDGAELQRSHTEFLRIIDDSAKARMRPALQYDENAISKTAMDKVDPRLQNQRVSVNSTMGEAVKPLLPPEYYRVEPWVNEHIQHLEELMDYLMASRDMSALAKARQTPAADTIEKMLELAGPVTMDISRGMERPMRDIGEMVKYLQFQFYSAKRRVQVMGQDGLTREDYDYDPANMIPSHMPFEDPSKPSAYKNYERARRHADRFPFQVTPHSMHQITQTTRKLMLLQMERTGFPIDPWTLAEANDLPNFGAPPKGTNTIIERWVAWQHMKTELQVELQGEIARAQAAGTIAGGGQPPTAGGQAPPPAPPIGGPVHNQGRPPTAAKPPHIEQKDGGTRTTVAES